MPLSIDGIEFSVFIREDSDQIKISLRSTGQKRAGYGSLEDALVVTG